MALRLRASVSLFGGRAASGRLALRIKQQCECEVFCEVWPSSQTSGSPESSGVCTGTVTPEEQGTVMEMETFRALNWKNYSSRGQEGHDERKQRRTL